MKTNSLAKQNSKREEYQERREEGFIKNYKSLRHKEEPKFRKFRLENVHTSNIKRPLKFSVQTNPQMAPSTSHGDVHMSIDGDW